MDVRNFPVGDLSTMELVELMNKVSAEVTERLSHRHGDPVDWIYGASSSFPGGQSIVDDWLKEMSED